MIKKEWKLESMGDLCDISSSKRIFMKEYVNEGIPFYRSKEIIKKHHDEPINETLYISTERYEEIKEKYGVPIEGDLLLTSVGTLGVPYLVKKEDKFYFKDGNLTWFKNFRSDVLSEYIYYWFQSDVGKREIDKITIGSTQKAITIDSLKKLSILLPPINVQRKICDILHSINYKITLNKRINSTLEEMAMTLYKHWFVENGDLERVSIEEFGSIIGGGTPKTTVAEYWDGNIPWISVKDLNSAVIIETEKKITEAGLNNSSTKLLPSFSTVLSARGTIGNISIIGKEMTMNQSCYAVKAKDELDCFVFLTLKSSINTLISQSHGSVFNTITKDTLKSLELPFNKDFAIKFEKKVKPMFLQILSNTLENKELQDIRDYLLPRLLSGEIDVSKAEKQVEEVL
ncbi:hypothetical protein B9L21_05860 [Geobacillus uzenensis]|uniref:Type I restriction modification DNA specificity domain-containing protein n=1 Tax=Geobacillus uzenensis TaxID=129339 RepID=A0ABX4DIB2_9BACL|nr:MULTISPECIES: restriction endonuclease subunit S [Geobacillus]OXB90288.1 hypothetical protein B9L21_05860 [Geobacillus uzenensis]